jgi:hypothetical protein
VCKGFVMYSVEWRDFLPGGFNDCAPAGAQCDPNQIKTIMDWLGPNLTGDMKRAPDRGTIFRYIRDQKVYRCPSHKLRNETPTPAIEQYTSYTAPLLLAGAPTTLLRSTRYPSSLKDYSAETLPTKDRLDVCIMPVILIEEDANFWLVGSKDSGWCNIDQISTRHYGHGGLGFIDGHVEHRKLKGVRSHQWIYELTDRRMISAGHCGLEPGFGWLAKQPSDLP